MIRVMPSRTMHEFQFDEEPLIEEKAEGRTGTSKRFVTYPDRVVGIINLWRAGLVQVFKCFFENTLHEN